jgi:hypothetical protein
LVQYRKQLGAQPQTWRLSVSDFGFRSSVLTLKFSK